ncbi:MAG: hypothetical protein M3416_02475 [Acidobacteriota bacterium]|nr:hypothetical protein [Acidobacteriota bacterium]
MPVVKNMHPRAARFIPALRSAFLRYRALLAAAVSLLPLAVPASAQEFTLELDNDFVRAHHNRVTVDVRFSVVGAQTDARPPANDGEVYISGAANDATTGRPLGFAAVAKIMHAAQYEGPGGHLQFIAAEGRANRPIKMRGVWRLWGEHGDRFVSQGAFPAPAYWRPRTNPPHVFEVHPVTHIQRDGRTVSFLEDFRFLPGFTDLTKARRTRGAFSLFERMTCRIEPGTRTTRITGSRPQFNFVQFMAELRGQPEPTPSGDGVFVRADIFDQTGRGASATEPLARDVRLVFTSGTAPEAELRRARGDGRLRLVGFARISLTPVNEAIVSRRPFEGKLPYEIVVTSLGSGG